jgi:hypothetical protein
MVGRGSLALVGATAAAAAAILYVHHSQPVERQNLRRGLARDAVAGRRRGGARRGAGHYSPRGGGRAGARGRRLGGAQGRNSPTGDAEEGGRKREVAS